MTPISKVSGRTAILRLSVSGDVSGDRSWEFTTVNVTASAEAR